MRNVSVVKIINLQANKCSMTSILYIQSNIGQKKLNNLNSVSNCLAFFFLKLNSKKSSKHIRDLLSFEQKLLKTQHFI